MKIKKIDRIPGRCGLKPWLRSYKPRWGFHVLREGVRRQPRGYAAQEQRFSGFIAYSSSAAG
jgi:hypothetical protein